jgi:hypothetical protein
VSEGEAINLAAALASFSEAWRPRIITSFQGCKVQVAKFAGDFIWHTHATSDDLFFCP